MKRHLILGLLTTALLSSPVAAQAPAPPDLSAEPSALAPALPSPAPSPAPSPKNPRPAPRPIAPVPDDPFVTPPSTPLETPPTATPILPPTAPSPFPTTKRARPYRPHIGARERNPFDAPPAAIINLRIRYEVFSLPLANAATLLRNTGTDISIYEFLTRSVSDETAVQETLTVVTVQSGLRAETSSIAEKIYPVEYEASSRPTSFETRNTGVTVEAEALFDATTQMVDLNIAPEHVSLVGNLKWGPKDAIMETPEFESQRLATSTRVSLLQPHLLGTVNRPPATSSEGERAKPRIWFAFATVSRVK